MDWVEFEIRHSLVTFPPCGSDADQPISTIDFTLISSYINRSTIPLQLFGVFCILLKSSKRVHKYKWLLLNYQIWLLLSTLDIAWVSVPTFYLPVAGGCSLGLLADLDAEVNAQGRVVATGVVFGGMLAAMLMLMLHRHQKMVSPVSWARLRGKSPTLTRVLVVAGAYAIHCSCLVPIAVTLPDQQLAKLHTIQYLKCLPYGVNTSSTFFLEDLIQTPWHSVIFYVAGLTVLFVCELVFLGVHATWQLRVNDGRVSKQTKSVQKKLLIVLCIQLSIPLIVILVPFVAFAVSVFRPLPNNSRLTNIWTLLLELHGVVATIALLSLEKSYRRFLIYLPFNMIKCMIKMKNIKQLRRQFRQQTNSNSNSRVHPQNNEVLFVNPASDDPSPPGIPVRLPRRRSSGTGVSPVEVHTSA